MPPMPMTTLPRFTAHTALTQWSPGALAIAAVTLLAVLYAGGVATVLRRGGRWSVAATLAWTAGLAALVVATMSSVAVYSDALFAVHMVQHLLLIMVVPLLLVAGRPLGLLTAAAPGTEPAVRGRVLSALTHPLVGLGLYTVAIVATHLTDFMNAMMTHLWLHALESTSYVMAGWLFFTPLVGRSPVRWQLSNPVRMLVLAVAMPVDTFTGVVLIQTPHYPWPAMAAMHPAWAGSLVDDLHLGGAIMWVGGDGLMAVVLGICAVAWARTATSGDGSELGGWLAAARVHHQAEVTGAVPDQAATGDSDEELAAYNAYLARLGRRG